MDTPSCSTSTIVCNICWQSRSSTQCLRPSTRSRRRFPASLCVLKELKTLLVDRYKINKGARPLVQNSNTRATRIALEEVERGLISFEFITQNPDLKSERDNRDVSGHDDGGVNREVTNQLSVSRLLSVGRLSD